MKVFFALFVGEKKKRFKLAAKTHTKQYTSLALGR
jgi:hypothetical protein